MADNATHYNEVAAAHAVFNLVMSSLVMAFNVVVIVVIAKGRQFQHPALWLMALVASFDFFVGLYVFIFVMPSALPGRFSYPYVVMHVAFQVRAALISQRVMNTALVTVDRYVAIQSPLRYHRIATKAKYIKIVSVTFVLNVLLSVASHMSLEGSYYNNVNAEIDMARHFNAATAVIPGGIFIACTFLIIVFCSGKILLAIVRSRHKTKKVTLAQRTIWKSSLMAALASFVFFVSFFPVSIINIVNLTTEKNIVPPIIFQFESFILLSNSLCNLFIYNATYRPFRKAVLYVFCKSYYRKKRQAYVVRALKMT